MINTELFKLITSDSNIYRAIYSLESYVFEKDLLNKEDYILLQELQDKFNDKLVSDVIVRTREILTEVLIGNEYFQVEVFFRPKKVENDAVVYRPLHTASLITQIAIVSILNGLIFDRNNHSVNLNELSNIIPTNFYGNLLSDNPRYLFKPWQDQYKNYSNDITAAYSKYSQNKKYKYEITLDLVNFFPNIDPFIVFDRLSFLLATKYNETEMEIFNTSLKKLLFMRVVNLDDAFALEYYGVSDDLDYTMRMVKGIPQGLPHAYLFGNIVMIEISSIFKNFFAGDDYYYVDDSVIYANDISQNSLLDEFETKVKELNINLKNFSEKYYKKNLKTLTKSVPDVIEKKLYLKNYLIQVHEGGKSSITEINHNRTGQAFLNLLSKEASLGAFEFRTIFSDNEDITLLNKFNALLKSIESEIERVCGCAPQMSEERKNQYLKMLYRFKKFFKYRIKLIEYKQNTEIDGDILKFINDTISTINMSETSFSKNVEKYFKVYEEDIFLSLLVFLLKNLKDSVSLTDLVDKINRFEEYMMTSKISKHDFDYNKHMYLSKVVSSLIDKTDSINPCTSIGYISINKNIARIVPQYKNSFAKNRRSAILKMSNEILSKGIEKWVEGFDSGFLENGRYSEVTSKSSEPFRMYLNGYISRVLNIDLSESLRFTWKDHKPLMYSDYRLVQLVRNKRTDVNTIALSINKIYLNDNFAVMDYSIFEVIEQMKTYVKDPKLIDDLILVHKYVSEMWKNGSKFLHFYTLHNQEHAVELIKSISLISKSIDYIQIGQFDYYILYLACYLHDISMVMYPDINSFVSDGEKSNLIYTRFISDIEKIIEVADITYVEHKKVKSLLVTYFKELDEYFEVQIRNNHANDSAKIIRNTSDLDFINICVREFVAEISASHGFITTEVYGRKSNAKNSLISKKYLMILIRFADLLDMSKNRITPPLLKNNMNYMSETTLFHWISHKAIDGYEINVAYNNMSTGNLSSFLSKGSIEEQIILKIFLNKKYDISVSKMVCDNVEFSSAKNHFELNILNTGTTCNEKICHFMCKWMCKKNWYLNQELIALNQYLSRSDGNLFTTKIKVVYEFTEDANTLSNEEYTHIKNYIGK